ncbi:flagellar basal body P-ring formation chaperone FlgA [Novosphingobium aerophilum]|uniref:flagellar basal body P-ring formation chaperone FlgA n=1 Tax=Novosphingobium TaxID=165696 RepID=UPI0006C84D1B|nr:MULTISPECIES: flagellar basal body P-ring formation chaperone FlgA [unclassified Novosphingobium]KPH62817.1 flagellar basal body P-ring biosynthesis protein FlgA [Novosphingobium sp. ST904]MPS71216.1 flagellar basal body P-ring formation protein FlgA [Novosphingobium sp.]TCM39228.1 flagella basal body P-ring formation protein FlgA [Novosphingobium sp. ST904]WRT92786.1 flagellar basal body P-ring formation chaperone FlgA [Novosphingobium sp. RL4]
MLTALLLAPALASAPALPAGEPAPVLARTVERGEVLSKADFVTAPVLPAVARNALSPAEAAGQEAVRRLNAGAPVRATDLTAPHLVRRGEAVTISLISGGLKITSAGRALSDGAKGEQVRVLNLATNRTLDAVAEGSGDVRMSVQ